MFLGWKDIKRRKKERYWPKWLFLMFLIILQDKIFYQTIVLVFMNNPKIKRETFYTIIIKSI